ncbi:MAG: serine/threonine protein kinase [Acidobacteria bacterium]|nr:serine/threonine protein kinase [Acidobacteriota bacterium]
MKYQIGQRVGDYILTAHLGSGATGHVFRVEHAVTHREEAMKVLCADSAMNQERAQRFLREAKVLAKLNHPNITAIHNAFWVDGDLAIVMELVDGESLRQVLDRGPAPFPQAMSYARQVLRALRHAHQKGVVHRDISPANILVTGDGRVKLTDFGLAKEPESIHLTQTGAALGSLHYSSPEQIKAADSADARSDLYSCGALFYELFTATRVFEAPSAFELMLAHADSKPAPPVQRQPKLPAHVNESILRALEKDPRRRFASAEAFLEALDGAGNQPGWWAGRAKQALMAAAGFLVITLGLNVLSAVNTLRTPVPPPPLIAQPPRPVDIVIPNAPPPELLIPEASRQEPAMAKQAEPTALGKPESGPKRRSLPPVAARPRPPAVPRPLPAADNISQAPQFEVQIPRTGAPQAAAVDEGLAPAQSPPDPDGTPPPIVTSLPNAERPGLLRSIGRRLNIFRKRPAEPNPQQ